MLCMKLRLARKQKETDAIWSFFFEPAGKVKWLAGQSIRLELPKKTWGVDERRFSIASAPYEKHIRITTRVSKSSFKQLLAKLEPGDSLEGYAIEGDFTWGETDMPRLFLSGGIGITPFRALLAQAVHDGTPLNTTLIHSFSDDKLLFGDELAAWQKKDPTFYVHYLPKTRLSLDSHSTLSPFWQHNLVYISGPEKMVQELAKSLTKQGLPKEQLKLDEFTGDIKA